MSRQYRVQAPQLPNAPALQPAPMQSDTYAPPPRPAINQNTAHLAAALSAFSGSIGGLIPTMMAERQKADEQALWAQQKKLSGMTREEFVKAVEGGTIPVYADEFKAKAIQSAHGMHYGAHRSDQIRQHLMTQFDWDNGDVDAFLTTEIRADMEKYGADQNFGAQYLREMGRLQSWAMDYREQRRTTQFVKAQGDAAFAVIDVKVNELIQAGTDPKTIAASVYGWYGELGKDGTLGVDHDALDKEVLNKARRLAGEHPEVALAMLEATRTGRGGQDLSLATRPDTHDAAYSIGAAARRVIAERQETAFREGVYSAAVDLLEAGNLDYAEDVRYIGPDGNERVISAEDQKERAVETYRARSRHIAAENREEPHQSLSREFVTLRNGGAKHPVVERAVAGIADMANAGMLTDDPEGKEKLKGKLLAYEWLQNESTASLLAYTTEEDRDFAETYLMAKRYLTHEDGRTYSDGEAMNFAIRSTEITRSGMPLAASARDEIHAQVSRLSTDPGWIWAGDAEPMNAAIAEQRVVNLAQRFVQLGVKPQRAVKMAGEAVKKTSSVYRGVLLDFQGRDVPDDFAEILDTTIADFAKAQPHVLERNGVKETDITIVPASSGSQSGGDFILADKETMLPLVDETGHLATVQLRDIRAKSAANAEERKNKMLRNVVLSSSIASRGYVEAVDTDGKTYWVDPKTREIVDYTYEESATAVPVWKKTGRRYKKGVLTPVEGGVELQPRGDLGIGAAGRYILDGMAANGARYRRAAKYLWDMVPEVKIGDTTVKEGPRFVD